MIAYILKFINIKYLKNFGIFILVTLAIMFSLRYYYNCNRISELEGLNSSLMENNNKLDKYIDKLTEWNFRLITELKTLQDKQDNLSKEIDNYKSELKVDKDEKIPNNIINTYNFINSRL